jgi:hypothetical protein
VTNRLPLLQTPGASGAKKWLLHPTDGGGGKVSLWYTFWDHLDYGFRGPPVFEGDMTISAYLFDITYNIAIILLLIAIM